MQIYCKLSYRVTLVIMQFALLIAGRDLSKMPTSYKYMEMYPKALKYMTLGRLFPL